MNHSIRKLAEILRQAERLTALLRQNYLQELLNCQKPKDKPLDWLKECQHAQENSPTELEEKNLAIEEEDLFGEEEK